MQRSSGRTRSVRAQIMMRVIPGVIIISLIIGIAGLLAIRANATRGLEQTHQNILNEASGQIDSELQEAINDVSTVAVGEAAQQFATMASSGITGDDFNVARNRLLNIFLGVARERPDSYLGIRILTRDGTVWSEVVNRSGANIANPVPQPELLETDPALRSSITADSGTVVFNRLTEQNAEGVEVPLLRFSAPVTHSSSAAQIVGAIQLDVPAANVIDSVIGASNLLPIGPQSRLLLVNNAGDILADSSSAAADIEAGSEAPDVSAPTSETDLQIARYLRGNLTEFTTQRVDNNLMSARFVPLRNGADMPWRLVLVEDASVALGSTDVLSGVVLVASVVLGVLIILLINAILRQALRPLGEASAAVQQMALNESGASGTVSELSDVSDGDQDEIGELLRAVHRNSQFLRAKSADLETEIDRRTRNLEIAASISRQTTTLRDVEEILNQTITLICEEFGFYHAQVYLVDDIGLNAVLAYSRGEVGRKLLEQGHKMLVGSQSVIGRVTATGAPVLLNDTSSSQNIPHSVNPLLSETRAEMALPLLIGSTTIGALDIQSTRANVFDEEEIGTFQLLADQVAIAIYNARLFAESEQRIDQIDTLNRQLTRMAWDTTIEEVGLADSYSYDLLSIERDQVQTDDGTITALSAPITIRGEHIGTLAAAAPEGDSFTENDHIILRAVADRVA
ncbi:MAG: GAF domain-containing protein, partial [Burkholderiales bacterium]|nr:GAF domain-containing protein [Anaerolineae bacterium]